MICKRATDLSFFDDFYNLKCDSNAIKWSGFEKAPDYNRLKEHFINLLQTDKIVLFYLVDDKVIGYSKIAFNNKGAELDGYSVLSEYAGKGYGSQIIKMSVDYLKDNFGQDKKIIAWVSENNIASQKCFKNNSFVIVDGVYDFRELKAMNRTDRFILLERL